MMYPYTAAPLDALFAAQASAGAVLGGALWQRTLKPRLANAALVAAVVLAVVAPIGSAPFAQGRVLRAAGVVLGVQLAKPALKLAAALATSAALLTRRRPLVLVAAIGEALLWPITDCIRDCEGDLAAAHLALFGLLVGVHLRGSGQPDPAPLPEARWEAWKEDAVALALGTLAGAFACVAVLHGWILGADEGAYTFQASLFAKLHAYGRAPRCSEAFRFFWVYLYEGRTFAQYTPGWPAFMAPFFLMGVTWLASPASLGLLAAAVMRLARRAATPATGRVAGRVAAGATLLSSTLLINGGSRYPHVFVAAMFAWALEALCAASAPGLSAGRRRAWGLLLGASAGLLLAARPLDGATLGLGLLACFAHEVVRGRLGRDAVVAAAVPLSILVAASVVVVRLQVGRWWTTGYSLGTRWYPWNTYGWSFPEDSEYRWGVPLAAGAYCWWPCSVAVGLGGLALLRGLERRLGLTFLVGCGALLAAYTANECGRKIDFGYGPRYQLPCVVPMAVGTGLLLARLWCSWRGGLLPPKSGGGREGGHTQQALGLAGGGAVLLAFGGAIAGVLLIAPLVYPCTSDDVTRRNWLHPALEQAHLHHAVVFAGDGPHSDARDLTENLPMDLYPDQEVLLALDLGDDAVRCVHESFPDRALYRAVAGPPVRFDPVMPPVAAP